MASHHPEKDVEIQKSSFTSSTVLELNDDVSLESKNTEKSPSSVMPSYGGIKNIFMELPISLEAFKICFYLIGWYVFNVIYVVQNKMTLLKLRIPWTLSLIQLSVGMLFAAFFWGIKIRKIPKIKSYKIFFFTFVPQAFCHMLVHFGAVLSMDCGAVSFTHIVKACEPVVTSLFSIIFLKEIMNIGAYLSLIPIVVGVSLASVSEIDFSWPAFGLAMLSNCGSSFRVILAKLSLKNKDNLGENLNAANIFMILIFISSIMSLPIVLAVEAPYYLELWTTGTSKMTNGEKVVIIIRGLVSAVAYYIYNDFAFLCLAEVNQITHSVANTFKRLLVIIFSIIFFNYVVSTMGIIGILIAVLGTFFYSYCKRKS